MKKFYAILAVLALVMISSMAMAEVNVSGSIDIRSLELNNTTDFSSKGAQGHDRTTQERIRINIDAKHDNVKGRISLENDWEQWGTETNTTTGGPLSGQKTGVESRQGAKLGFREAWIDATIPGAAPAHFKVGHQFLQLGNGWFFRSMKYGSDAWLVGLPGKNTVAFVNVKAAEVTSSAQDDIDAYVLLDNFKIDDTKTVGAYFARVKDSRNLLLNGLLGVGAAGQEANIDNIGLWFNGKLGPATLQAELDFQMGTAKAGTGGTDAKFKGTQIVLQANMPIDPLSINATIAQGSGDKTTSTSPDVKSYLPLLDADPHYTIVYEYFVPTACGLKNMGFCNTTAFNIGAGYAVTKNISVNLDFWMLNATEKVTNKAGEDTDEIGSEIDLVVKLKLYDQLTWNWQLGRLMAGKMYNPGAGVSADPVDAIQGVLSYKF